MSNEELCLLIQDGETNRIGQLWDQVKKLVAKLSFRYLPKDGSSQIEHEDLIQSGFLAMLDAIEDYDPAAGYTFATYLGNHLRNACRDVLGIKTSKQARDPINRAISLSQPVSSESKNLTLEDLIQDHSLDYVYTDLIEEVARSQDCQKIFAEVERLDSPAREIFMDKFFHGRKENDIASRYGLKKHKVTNIITRSLGKIRRSGIVRLMSVEYRQDQETSFYRNKGLKAFNTSFSSTIEDLVIRRDELWQRIIRDLRGVESVN